MENTIPVFDRLLVEPLGLFENLALSYSAGRAWSGCKFALTLTDCFSATQSDSPIDRRIHHYVNWCLAENCGYVYAQPLFIANRSGQVSARMLTFEILSDAEVQVTISAVGDYADVILSSGLDQTLLNSIRDAIIVTEAEPFEQLGPRILYVNRVFERMSGYLRGEILGLTPRILQSQRTDENAKRLIRESLRRCQSIKIQMNNVTKHGEHFEVELDISPVKDITGWWTHWIAVQREVTQENLAKSEQAQSRMIIQSTGIGTWKLELQRMHMIWDAQMCALFEVEPTTNGSSYATWQKHLHPDDVDELTREFAKIEAGEKELDCEFRIMTGNQQTRYLHARAEVRYDDEGRALSLDGFCLDITQRREYESKALKQQEFAIHQDRLASIGELAAGVGHEVNNPLSIVIGFAEQLARLNNERFSDPDIAASIVSILAASERIGNIVSGLRTFTHFHEDIEVFSLTQAYHDTIQLIDQIYQHEGVQLSLLDHTDGVSLVRGNRGRIQQVLLNLLSNAKDATEDQPRRHITVSLQNHGNTTKFSVADNGSGMDAQTQSKVFNAFFTTKPAGKGTGIGLSISKSIVHEHSGTLTFTTGNKGSVFTLCLPQAFDDAVPLMTAVVNIEPAARRKLTVFVVDDEPGIRELLASALNRAGMVATAFSGAKQALDALVSSAEGVDLVVSDVQMPEMTGMALAAAIRLNPNVKQPRFILITGGDRFIFGEEHGDLEDLVDSVICKPFRMTTIVEQILALFDESKPQTGI